MSDLVEQLRVQISSQGPRDPYEDLLEKAADEIERLRNQRDHFSFSHNRVIDAFDKDETAVSFLRDDGEGGFASGVYRMAREIERLSAAHAELLEALKPFVRDFNADDFLAGVWRPACKLSDIQHAHEVYAKHEGGAE